MTSIVKLEALSGVKDDGPLCYLLQVDDSYILLDCGWDENFDLLYIDAVKRRVPQINAVLLTFADPAHLGALPYLVAKCGLTCPVYATVPVYKMGQMFLYDWINSHMNVEDFELFSLDDVDAAFERVQQVKYNQTVLLKGESGLQVTPLPAGHMIGGAFWRISKMGDDEIVYAVDFNHKKERHLNGCLFDAIQRPHLLITDAFNALYKQPGRKQRDEKLVTQMFQTLRKGGDCLVVIDTAGRVLEIAHLLDQLWSSKESGLSPFNLVMLSHVASSVVEFAKSQVEWMSDKILKSFESGRYNPFQFRHVQLCHSLPELARVRSPKVVLCSDLAMECGFSRELFLEWCSTERNTIIVTGRSGERTLGAKLIHMSETASTGQKTNRQLKLEIKRRIRLEGSELEAYRARKKQEQQEEARKRMEASRRTARIGLADDSDSDSDDEEAIANAVAAVNTLAKTAAESGTPGVALSTAATPVDAKPGTVESSVPHPQQQQQQLQHVSPHDILLRWEQQQRASFFKHNKKSFPMFAYVEEKVKCDDYGEVIRPEDYAVDTAGGAATAAQEPARPTATKTESAAEGAVQLSAVQQEEREWPTKCVKYIEKLEVLCRVEYIEFEGRSDGESLKKILTQIKPKQLILVHGNAMATRHLYNFAESIGIQKRHMPKLGETIDATIESHIFQVALSDALLSSLVFQNVKEAELSWIDARLMKRIRDAGEAGAEEEEKDEEMAEEAEEDEEEEKMEVDGPEKRPDSLAVLPARRLRGKRAADKFVLDVLAAHSIPSHQAVFVNDPKLSDVKQQLLSEGFQAEFSSGVLYINGIASIKRTEAGRFHVEGCASEEFYRIRDIVYSQFAVV